MFFLSVSESFLCSGIVVNSSNLLKYSYARNKKYSSEPNYLGGTKLKSFKNKNSLHYWVHYSYSYVGICNRETFPKFRYNPINKNGLANRYYLRFQIVRSICVYYYFNEDYFNTNKLLIFKNVPFVRNEKMLLTRFVM